MAANSDIPDFATRGGNVSVQEGGKVTLPCQVNDLGSRTVSQVNDLGSRTVSQVYDLGSRTVSQVIDLKLRAWSGQHDLV